MQQASLLLYNHTAQYLVIAILPDDLKTGKVPLVNSEVRAADDIASVKVQAWLQADAAVL